MKITKKTCTREVPKIALCTLGSINWGAFRNPEDMKRAAKLLCRSLNNILDYQDFLSIHSKLSNEDIRPLGVGVVNLAYWHAKRGYKYGATDALQEVKTWIEHQYYYLMEANVELAEERGKCEASDRLSYGKGVFVWEKRAEGVNELADFTPDSNLDWQHLRERMMASGVRNATVGALPPVESCQRWSNQLNFANGDRKNFHELLADQGIDWKHIETTAEPGTVVLLNTPIKIAGVSGVEHVTEIVFNGFQPLNTVEFEDGKVMHFTDNHRLLVTRNGVEEWFRLFELANGYSIACGNELPAVKIKKITKHSHEDYTWDITTPSHTFLLPNNCVSHNSSVCINATNGIEMPVSLISTKDSKAGAFTQVVPEYNKLKHKYQLMWDQTDCVEYLKTAAVLGVYTDQGISTNTFYSPKHYPGNKVPATLIATNLMLGHHWGLKSFYYSLIDKSGAKDAVESVTINSSAAVVAVVDDDEESCDACKL